MSITKNMNQLKFGAVVPVYNRERFIGPYLEMLKKFGVIPVVTLGTEPWKSQGNDEVLEPDKTELILNKFFPEVKVLKGFYAHQRDSFNIGINWIVNESGYNCDIIMVNDCDMYITSKDWEACKEFIELNSPTHDVFSINFENMIQEYYFDHRYGRMALRGGDPPVMAIGKNVRMETMTRATSWAESVWDLEGPKWHHMRFCKPNGSGKKRCAEPTPETHNMNDFTPAPPEIFESLERWNNIIKTL